jgi:hypothetical protein
MPARRGARAAATPVVLPAAHRLVGHHLVGARAEHHPEQRPAGLLVQVVRAARRAVRLVPAVPATQVRVQALRAPVALRRVGRHRVARRREDRPQVQVERRRVPAGLLVQAVRAAQGLALAVRDQTQDRALALDRAVQDQDPDQAAGRAVRLNTCTQRTSIAEPSAGSRSMPTEHLHPPPAARFSRARRATRRQMQ